MLEGLRRRYHLVLVSNTNALHFEMIRETYAHLLRHFDDLVLSYEVRAMKPQPEIFQAALELGGMSARGVLLYGRHRGIYRGGEADGNRCGAI